MQCLIYGVSSPPLVAPQDPAYASFLFEELQHLQWPGGGHHTPQDVRCDACDASFLQLRRLALRHALGIDRKVALRAVGCRGSEGSWGGNVPPSQQQRLSYKEREGGAPWVWGGVQSPYLGGGGVKGLANVTPLPLGVQHHLEGVWRVTCCQPEVQKQTTVSRDGQMSSLFSSPLLFILKLNIFVKCIILQQHKLKQYMKKLLFPVCSVYIC